MNIKWTLPIFFSLLLLSFVFSCQRPFLTDDQAASKANWELVGLESERQIQGMHATPFEWYTISEDEFFRYNGDNELIEKRKLFKHSGVLGIPALTDNTFVRLTTNDNAEQVLEFHLTRNAAEIHSVIVDSLAAPGDSFVEVEFQAHDLGAFSTDGTIYMTAIEVLPERHFALLMFEVLHNQDHTSFTSIEMVKRVNLTELSTDLAKLMSIRFVNGNFYVTSQEGAWRVTPSGNIERIFNQWMLSVFPYQGDNYITGVNTFDLHKSIDNGIEWERLNHNSELKVVTNANELLFTQTTPGLVFQLANDDLKSAREFILPEGYEHPQAIYFGAFFFADYYYFSFDREVYRTDAVVVQ